MTVVAVVTDPPREGLVFPELAATSPLSEAEAAELYEAVYRDALLAVAGSGGDLLVNYPTDELLPPEHRSDTAPAAELRAIAADTLETLDGVRFEKQVGSTFDARAGNAITHLLREEGAGSAAVIRPNAPLVSRSVIDAAAMKLRRDEVVLGPSTRGRTYYAGFVDPIDFDGAFAEPELQTLTDRSRDAGYDVEFVNTLPTLETGSDLLDLLPLLRARYAAERVVPPYTTSFVHELGLEVVCESGERRVVRGN